VRISNRRVGEAALLLLSIVWGSFEVEVLRKLPATIVKAAPD
jgi:hypothetical protein